MRIPLRRTFASLMAVASLGVVTSARAQSVTVSTIVKRYVGGRETQPRAQGLNPTGISFDDCDKKMVLAFTYTQTGVTTANNVQAFEVWVGTTECRDKNARGEATGGTGQQCWQLARLTVPPPVSGTVEIPVRAIVSEQKQGTTLVTGDADPDICGKGSTGVRSYNVQFLPIDSKRDVIGTPGSYPINAKLFGPAAVSNVSAGSGDGLLTARWTPPSDTTILGFRIFCDPPPGREAELPRGSAPVVDAQADVVTTRRVCPDSGTSTSSDAALDGSDEAGDADLDGAATTSDASVDSGCYEENVNTPGSSGGGSTSGCSSSVLVARKATATTGGEGGTQSVGPPTSIPDTYKCAEATGVNTGGANVTGVKNGVEYAIAVAAYDNYGNNGLLSGLACRVPEQTDDFWDRYRSSGGGAGGAFCGCMTVGADPANAVVWLGAAGALCVTIGIRRRRR
jgi:hypothetical protein